MAEYLPLEQFPFTPFVMAALVAAIHKRRVPLSRMDGRDKPGHDTFCFQDAVFGFGCGTGTGAGAAGGGGGLSTFDGAAFGM
jgi:hypothetical protein